MERLSRQQWREYNRQRKCYICGKDGLSRYVDEENLNQRKVRDHCHLTGRFRGAAHSICNLQYRINPDKIQIPVFFHNL